MSDYSAHDLSTEFAKRVNMGRLESNVGYAFNASNANSYYVRLQCLATLAKSLVFWFRVQGAGV